MLHGEPGQNISRNKEIRDFWGGKVVNDTLGHDSDFSIVRSQILRFSYDQLYRDDNRKYRDI